MSEPKSPNEEAHETTAKIRRELEALTKITDALEGVEDNAKRLRVLAAVAALLGHDDEAQQALLRAQRIERERGGA